MFHQPAHSTFTDEYAILLCETELHFTKAKAFIRFCINLQNLFLKLLILLHPGREMAVDVLIVSTPVYVKNPAKDGDPMLFGKRLDRF